METCIRKYAEIDMKDIDTVGYKNASFGKMIGHMIPNGVNVPKGFAITAEAYRYFINYNKLDLPLKFLMAVLDRKDFSNLSELSGRARKMIMGGKMPADLGMQIIDAYDYLFDLTETAVAVRSSAIGTHLTDAAASGLNDSFLNVKGHCALLYAIRQCFASLYTDRAVRQAIERGYDPNAVAMPVGIQQMIRADSSCSGVGYTNDPRIGSADMIYVKGTWGLGEVINKADVEPDEYLVFKPSLKMASILLVEKDLGSKSKMMVYADDDDETNQTILKDTPLALQHSYVLTDKEVQQLADWAILIEKIYQRPMCFEWAKDGRNHQLYLIQVSPSLIKINHFNKCTT